MISFDKERSPPWFFQYIENYSHIMLDLGSNYQIFTWSPSLLFKNIKSIIKIANTYDEIVPLAYLDRYYYRFDSSFKGNKTEFLFSLINILVSLEDMPDIEPLVSKIKGLITKTNELLFELCQRSIPLEMINLLKN